LSTWRERPDLVRLQFGRHLPPPQPGSDEVLDGRHDLGGGEKRRNVVPAVHSQEASIDPLGEGAYGRKDRVLCAGNGHRPIS
jgi:hypothetical protein